MLIVVIVHTQQSDILPAAQLAVEYDLLFMYLLFEPCKERETSYLWEEKLDFKPPVECLRRSRDFSRPSLPAPSFVYTSVYISSVVEQVYFLSTCFLLLLFFEKFFKE